MWRFWKRRPRTIVLGQQLADARAAEERRLATCPGPSPMPDERYDQGYLDALNPAPIELDAALTRLVRDAVSLQPAARDAMRRSISMDEIYTLLAFARRCALFSMRYRSTDPLKDAFGAIALIELARVDYRDVATALALLGHAALRIGLDTRRLASDATTLAQPEVARLIADFAGRPIDDEKLCRMAGLRVVHSKYGLGLVQSAFSPYAPTFDLTGLMIEIAELLEADRYRVGGFELATGLPSVWLRAAGEKAVQKALRGARAGASVSGFLRPEIHPTHGSQSIFVFVVEMHRLEQAQALLEMSRLDHPGHALLGCMQGSLFCLVVARSWWSGVESYETTAGLTRLEPGIAEILRGNRARTSALS